MYIYVYIDMYIIDILRVIATTYTLEEHYD